MPNNTHKFAKYLYNNVWKGIPKIIPAVFKDL